MIAEDHIKLECLQLAKGDLQHAQQLYEWAKPAATPHPRSPDGRVWYWSGMGWTVLEGAQ